MWLSVSPLPPLPLQGVGAGTAVAAGDVVVEALCLPLYLCESVVVVGHTGEHHPLLVVVLAQDFVVT